MRTYAYLRFDSYNHSDQISYSSFLREHGFNVQKNRVIIEEVGGEVSVIYRNKLNNLIEYSLENNDLLIVKGIDSLGSNFAEILKITHKLDQKGIRLICVDYSKYELTGDKKVFFLHFLKLCLAFETLTSKNNPKPISNYKFNKVGRPEKLTKEQKKEVMEKYKKGWTVYRLAMDFNVSRTVIQRVLDKEVKNKELTVF
ncbi:recombinase family protein [Acinetobacter baumannii]|uniref:recombinase family protein n=1 Tax=Acinetobacter baumannii TaxID=470 RepID=UPI0038B64E06